MFAQDSKTWLTIKKDTNLLGYKMCYDREMFSDSGTRGLYYKRRHDIHQSDIQHNDIQLHI